jgi:hypothetical protein
MQEGIQVVLPDTLKRQLGKLGSRNLFGMQQGRQFFDGFGMHDEGNR